MVNQTYTTSPIFPLNLSSLRLDQLSVETRNLLYNMNELLIDSIFTNLTIETGDNFVASIKPHKTRSTFSSGEEIK